MEVKFNDSTIELWMNGIHQATFPRNQVGWNALARHCFDLGVAEARSHD